MSPLDDAPAVARKAVASITADGLLDRFTRVRGASIDLASPLSAEDQGAQAMADASPTKWHLAHTSWFFETFILKAHVADYGLFDPIFTFLFNSYYEQIGERHPRPQRGLLTRPALAEVIAYRRHVDRAMERLLSGPVATDLAELVLLGLAHEEQHQELILMDILSLFAASPLKPRYSVGAPRPRRAREAVRFVALGGGRTQIGHADGSFAFDNEGPAHEVLLGPFALASRLVTNGEWLEFMAAGGYRRAEFWHADGWASVTAEGWEAPLYWERDGEVWRSMTLEGLRPIDLQAPVVHVSYYEAAAFAAFAGKRLPTEAEWEHAAVAAAEDLEQLDGHVWQWTSSAYSAHPGFRPAAGAVGEYNGKFMVGQMVLKGGACVTPVGHVRRSYRNFFYPHQRWMFAGLRLVDDTLAPAAIEAFRADVRAGLSAARKGLPAKWFYDARGSELFEAITRLPQYYPTRQESELLAEVAPRLAAEIPPGANLVELGSGASVKTRLLLDAAGQIETYTPVDISRAALDEAAAVIARDYPRLAVNPVVGDFTTATDLPAARAAGPPVGFFPGSTIGNFAPGEAVGLLARIRRWLGKGSLLIIGVDLAKDAATLEAAYDDPQGVTAEFNLNILTRINRELGGDLDPGKFAHLAVWNEPEGRVEMHLRALSSHTARAAGIEVGFVGGETVHTENSYKFSEEGFAALATRAGWKVKGRWISPPPRFAVFLLQA
jgi:dimethylhistidine N-methyltransferase